MDDLISILPYEALIPLSIERLHLSGDSIGRREDLLLRGEHEGILRRERLIRRWKLHDEGSWSRHFFS